MLGNTRNSGKSNPSSTKLIKYTQETQSQIDNIFDQLIERILDEDEMDIPSRILVSIFGIPGSGKTTLATYLGSRLDNWLKTEYPTLPCTLGRQDRLRNSAPRNEPIGPTFEVDPHNLPTAVVVPMDGFHLTRAQLAALPNPDVGFARRGAEFTFDGPALFRLVQAVRMYDDPPDQPGLTDEPGIIIRAPSFDHAKKDPVPKAIPVPLNARVVIFEGLYLNMDRFPWKQIADLMDFRCLVTVSNAVAASRLIKRHLASGIASTEAEAKKRVEDNDLKNGDELMSLMLYYNGGVCTDTD